MLKKLVKNFNRDLHISVDAVGESHKEQDRDYSLSHERTGDVEYYDDDEGDGGGQYEPSGGGGQANTYQQPSGQPAGGAYGGQPGGAYGSGTGKVVTNYNRKTHIKTRQKKRPDANAGLSDFTKLFKGKSFKLSFKKARNGHGMWGGMQNGPFGRGRFGRGLNMFYQHQHGFHGHGRTGGIRGHDRGHGGHRDEDYDDHDDHGDFRPSRRRHRGHHDDHDDRDFDRGRSSDRRRDDISGGRGGRGPPTSSKQVRPAQGDSPRTEGAGAHIDG